MTDKLDTFYCIPHTHWEGAVFKTRAEYLDMGLPHILQALRLLRMYPAYRFTLDQSCYVQPFLERYPEQAACFRQFVEEGRLAIVGGTLVMPDVNMPSGESFVRQMILGKSYFRRTLGVDVTSGWQLDTFGHNAQMPQLLNLAGYTAFWFMRGVKAWGTPAEFLLDGIDGSQIPAYWIAETYGNLAGSPTTVPEFAGFMRERYEQLAPSAGAAGRVGFAGADVFEPEVHLPDLLDEFNSLPDKAFNMVFAVPADFEAAANTLPSRQAIAGELNPIFQGIYSSRIEVKQITRELESLLTSAEKLGAILQTQGVATDRVEMWRGWEPMLFNQAHDIMSGVMTNHVYDDTMASFGVSERIAHSELESRLAALSARIDTRCDGIPVIVTNTLGSQRTDLATVTVGFTDATAKGVRLLDSSSREIPCQIIDAVRLADGTLVSATIAFVAVDIPALGHAVYCFQPVELESAAPTIERAETAILENEHYRVQIDGASGAITQVSVRDGAWDVLSAAGNVVAMEPDHGDFWELYKPLDAAMRIAGTNRHEPPQAGQATFSTAQTDEIGTVTSGPVFSEFTVTHPFSAKGRFATTIRLVSGSPRIEIRTRILNHDSEVRYRVLFPTSIQDGHSVHEIPFGAIERPEGIEMPAQNWVDWSDGSHGVTLLNRGLPGNNIAGGTAMLSLMRCTSIVAYGYQGGYEPWMGSDSGQELGKELTFDYAVIPHAGNWREGAPWQQGLAFNQPLLARTAEVHAGPQPRQWGFLTGLPDNVAVSTLMPGEIDGTVLRIYEAAGTGVEDAAVRLPESFTRVDEVNLMEDLVQPLTLTDNTLRFSLRAFEIKTFKLR